LRGWRLLRRLDPLDLKLLSLLEGGTATYTEVARRLGVSRSTIYRRLARLKRLGLVEGFRPVFGGLEHAYLLLPADPSNLESLIEALKGNPHVLEVYRVGSRSSKLRGYGVLVKLAALGRAELQRQAEHVISTAGGGLVLFIKERLAGNSAVSRLLEESYRLYWGMGVARRAAHRGSA